MKRFGHMYIQYIPRNMHTVFALLCFVVVIHGLIFPYPSGLLHWHCSNLTIAPVPAKQPWWIWINTSCEFIMNDCITTTKQSTTKPCVYFLGYTVHGNVVKWPSTSHANHDVTNDRILGVSTHRGPVKEKGVSSHYIIVIFVYCFLLFTNSRLHGMLLCKTHVQMKKMQPFR